MADNTKTAKIWHDAGAATPECLPLEVLERMTENASFDPKATDPKTTDPKAADPKAADPKAAAHLAGCPHCQTELSMLKSFEAAAPTADEGAAVAWITAQLQRQQPGATKESSATRAVPFWRSLFRVPYLAGAAALSIVLALGISLYNSGTNGPHKINGTNIGTGTFRDGAVRVISPSGDLEQVPSELRWEAYPGAASYAVELKDVLGSPLGSAKSAQNSVAVTPEMVANMRPGKPLKWQVTVLDATGKAIADSGNTNFKIK